MNLSKYIMNLFRRCFLKKHKYPASTLIRRQNGSIIFEIEFNWFDEDLNPVAVVREVHSNKIFSVRHDEMLEFCEYTGSDPNPGSTL